MPSNAKLLPYSVFLATLALAGCNIEPRNQSPVTADRTLSTGNTPGGSAGLSCSLSDQKAALVKIMTPVAAAQSASSTDGLYYLTPNIVDPAPYATLSDLLNAMKSPQDRWSFIEQGGSSGNNSGLQGTSNYQSRFGFRWSESGGQIRINYIFANSPAANASLQRGATITTVNGQAVTSASQFATALNSASVTLGLSGGTSVALSRANFTSPDISDVNVYTLANGSRAGYFYLDNFNNLIESEYSSAFAQFKAQNVQSLIIDLRYNGGGLIISSYQLAHMIVGNSKQGLAFNSFKFNGQHSSKNETLNFNLNQFSSALQNSALSVNKVVFLTTASSASASELLIKGLEPHIDVAVVGSNSNGKPYGMQGVKICDNTVWPLSFLNENSNLQTTPATGIPPTCPVTDDLNNPLGNTNEAMLNKAISYLNTNSCA
ncbi:MAG: S41 family peptidase [Pseudomonadales bacterium]